MRREETLLTLGPSSHSQVPQQERPDAFSQTSRRQEFDTRIFHLCPLGASRVWLPPWNRPQISHEQRHLCFGGAVCHFTYARLLLQPPTHRDL